MQGRFEKKKSQKSGGWKKILLIFVISVLLLIVAVGVGVAIYYNSMLNKINIVQKPTINYTQAETEVMDETGATEETMEEFVPETTAPHVASSEDYINILVVGQAAREGEEERFADTQILVTLNTYEKTLTMTSMLRDAFVKMPDYKGHYGGRIKLTTIYHLGSQYGDGIAGSMELMNQTLYDNFGIEVDYNFEVDFNAFVWIIDAIGGIDVELTEAEAEYLNDDDVWVTYDVEPGMAHLDGMAALSYARMRKASGDNESDINRTSRQRKVMEIVLEELKTHSLAGLQDLANDVLPKISTNMTKSEITEMLVTLLPMLWDLKIETGGTCPANYQGDMVDIYGDGFQHSVLRFDVAETKKTMRAITEGEGLEATTAAQ